MQRGAGFSVGDIITISNPNKPLGKDALIEITQVGTASGQANSVLNYKFVDVGENFPINNNSVNTGKLSSSSGGTNLEFEYIVSSESKYPDEFSNLGVKSLISTNNLNIKLESPYIKLVP